MTMNLKPWTAPLAVWAARDLIRRPAQALVLFFTLTSVVALMALVLLIDQTLSTACRRLMVQAPAIVVRRITAGGWAPMPVESVARVRSVAGVLRPRVRVWGVARGPNGPVTVVGLTGTPLGQIPDGRMPQSGQALVGRGVLPPEGMAGRLSLHGRQQVDVEIAGRLPEDSSMAAYDVAVMPADDARRLLGLNADQASDLVLDVFHEDETQALKPELADAFDWPVHVTTRREQLERYLTDISRRTGVVLAGFGPALLAMALMVGAIGAAGRQRRWEAGLLKALGWTGGELLRLQVWRGTLIGGPAIVTGVAVAYAALFQPGMTWLTRWLFDWHGPAPGLYLSVAGAAGGLLLSALLAGVPFLAAVFWTGWQAASADPADCVEGGP